MKEPFFHRNNLKDMPSMFVNNSNGSDADRRLVSLRAVFPAVTSLLP